MWDNIRMETPTNIAYPHIVKEAGYCGGRAAIDSTRVRVADVAWLEKQGKTAREILGSYPDLTLSQVHAALLYFYEHTAEIEAELAEDERWHENHARAKAGYLTKDGPR